MKTTRIKPDPCRECGKPTDAISDFVTDNVPVEGDVSICMGCGVVSLLDADLRSVAPTDEEMLDLLQDKTVRKMLGFVAEANRTRP